MNFKWKLHRYTSRHVVPLEFVKQARHKNCERVIRDDMPKRKSSNLSRNTKKAIAKKKARVEESEDEEQTQRLEDVRLKAVQNRAHESSEDRAERLEFKIMT